MSLTDLIRSRRTIHNFLPEPVPESALLNAIDAARWAPNHKLTEPWRFILIGPQTAGAVADLNADLVAEERGPDAAAFKRARWKTMPGWFAVTCRRSGDPLRMQEDYAACACAIQNLMLALWSEGIGTKWGSGPVTRDPRFFDLLGLDAERETVVGLFWYGHPETVPPMQRKPVREIVRRVP